jgi:FHA domain
MDLVDAAILALRLALVLVLYLFLWLVVRSAWHALEAAPRPAPGEPSDMPRPRRQPLRALRLQVLESGGSGLPLGQVIELSNGATLGRAGRSSLVIADPAVSAEHARVALLEGEWVIADLGSTNGTLVNQARVQGEAALEAGDVVSLGNVRLKVVGR